MSQLMTAGKRGAEMDGGNKRDPSVFCQQTLQFQYTSNEASYRRPATMNSVHHIPKKAYMSGAKTRQYHFLSVSLQHYHPGNLT